MSAGGIPDMFRGSPLIEASFFGKLEVVKDLITRGSDVNEANEHGLTALILGAMKDRIECVQALIDAGVDLNAASNDGWTAVASAARNDCSDSAKLLVSAGADVNIVDTEGFTALSRAGSCGFYVTLQELLKAQSVDVNKRCNNGRTALFSTTFSSEEELIEEYASFGRDFDPERQSLVRCADLLIEAGAEVNVVDPDGNTPLTLAAQCENIECLCAFIKAGADVTYARPDGQTALSLAEARGHHQCVAALKSAAKK